MIESSTSRNIFTNPNERQKKIPTCNTFRCQGNISTYVLLVGLNRPTSRTKKDKQTIKKKSKQTYIKQNRCL